ncbi:hypothetical protein [Symbiobacterium terraclitae]|uniref:hypothetical protein n=1 Tax=Symbiobacterium terraclitae TaxID=557451 RepID=UPI0035B53022
MSRREDLEYFYQLMHQLEGRVGGKRLLSDLQLNRILPRMGVYFFFEPGEYREDGHTPRVVRVGTHAVSAGSQTTLWNRLSQHRGRLKGGGGNHRGSIFRLHVGTALLNRGLADAAAGVQWGSPRRPEEGALREAERRVEEMVSQYIRSMPFLWVAVDDPPSKASHRKVIEANAIGLLSNLGREPVDPPSPGWLGHWADRPAVRESGLWNVNHVDDGYDPGFLDLLERYIKATSVGRWRG